MTDKQLCRWMDSAPQVKIQLRTGCHIWMGAKSYSGYGLIWHSGNLVSCHRLMWFLTYGYRPKKIILHSCDNPSCINIDHLREGSHTRQHADDKVKRNRQSKGESVKSAKLSEEDVLQIRRKYKTGRYYHRDLGLEIWSRRLTDF